MMKGKTIKKFLAVLLTAVMAASLLAGCGGGGSSSSGSASASTKPMAGKKVGLIISATYGSQSFNDVILAGAQKAADEFGYELQKVENVQPAQSVDTFRTMIADGTEYFILMAASYADAGVAMAKEYPNVKFLSIDADIPNAPENVCSVSYREQEAAFLTGAFCQLMSKTGKVAFIGGTEGGTMVRFESGFSAGSQYINKNGEVSVSYVGFNDVNKGKETALMLYNKGFDWIAGAAAASNLGIFQASKEKGGDNYVCGAADGQFHLMPDRIVVSQVKRVDNVAYNMLKEYAEGKFQSGAHLNMGLKEEGVDMLYTTKNADLLKIIPEDVKTKIEALRKDIIDGKIKVPATKDELASFNK